LVIESKTPLFAQKAREEGHPERQLQKPERGLFGFGCSLGMTILVGSSDEARRVESRDIRSPRRPDGFGMTRQVEL